MSSVSNPSRLPGRFKRIPKYFNGKVVVPYTAQRLESPHPLTFRDYLRRILSSPAKSFHVVLWVFAVSLFPYFGTEFVRLSFIVTEEVHPLAIWSVNLAVILLGLLMFITVILYLRGLVNASSSFAVGLGYFCGVLASLPLLGVFLYLGFSQFAVFSTPLRTVTVIKLVSRAGFGAILMGATSLSVDFVVALGVGGTSIAFLGPNRNLACLTAFCLTLGLCLGASTGTFMGSLIGYGDFFALAQVVGGGLGSVCGVVVSLVLVENFGGNRPGRTIFSGLAPLRPALYGALGAILMIVEEYSRYGPFFGIVLAIQMLLNLKEAIEVLGISATAASPFLVSLEPTDRIDLVNTNVSGWWTGYAHGQKIRFPSTFVELSRKNDGGQEVFPLTEIYIPTSRKCLAVKRYSAKQGDEMSLEIGDEIGEIYVDASREDGSWWVGRSLLDNRKGSFPARHVVPHPSPYVSLMFVLNQFVDVDCAVVVRDSFDFHGMEVRSGDLVPIVGVVEAIVDKLRRSETYIDCRELRYGYLGRIAYDSVEPWLSQNFAIVKNDCAMSKDGTIDLQLGDIIRLIDVSTSAYWWLGTNLTSPGKPTGRFPSWTVRRLTEKMEMVSVHLGRTHPYSVQVLRERSQWRLVRRYFKSFINILKWNQNNFEVDETETVLKVYKEITFDGGEIVCSGHSNEDCCRLRFPPGSVPSGKRQEVGITMKIARFRHGKGSTKLFEIFPDYLLFQKPVNIYFTHGLNALNRDQQNVLLYYSPASSSQYKRIAELKKIGQTEYWKDMKISLERSVLRVTSTHFCGFGLRQGYFQLIFQVFVPKLDIIENRWTVHMEVVKMSEQSRRKDSSLRGVSRAKFHPIHVNSKAKQRLCIEAAASEGWLLKEEQKRRSISYDKLESVKTEDDFWVKQELSFERISHFSQPEANLTLTLEGEEPERIVVQPWRDLAGERRSRKRTLGDSKDGKKKRMARRQNEHHYPPSNLPSKEEKIEQGKDSWKVVMAICSVAGDRWEDLADMLRLSPQIIEQIKINTQRLQVRCRMVIVEWMNGLGVCPTFGALIDACEWVGIAKTRIEHKYEKFIS